MIENFIYTSPLLLLAGALIFLLMEKREPENAGNIFRATKLYMLISFSLTAVFYNKAGFEPYMRAGLFTLPFQILTYLGGFSVILLSRKWYTGLNVSGYTFCTGLILSLLCGNILILSNNLGLTSTALFGLMGSQTLLLYHAERKKETSLSVLVYTAGAAGTTILLLAGCLYFKLNAGNLDYNTLAGYIQKHPWDLYSYAAAYMMLIAFLFVFGQTPLHFWFTESMGLVILPVLTYFMLVPVFACWAGFIRLNILAFGSLQNQLEIFYHIIAVFSLVIGALGSCSGKNMRKTLAYSTVFHLGIILLIIRSFTPEALNGAFIYLFSYLLAMLGICTSLYGFKIKGEYLFMLSDFEGAAYKRPYLCALMTVFLFSLIGFPPFLGFLGLFSVLNNLIGQHNFITLTILLTTLIIISYSYLQIIKTMYFENSKDNFDRVDTGIYMALWLNTALMIFIMLQPRWLVQDLDLMLEDIFQWLT